MPAHLKLLQNFARHIQLTPDEQARATALFHPKKIKKKAVWLREGEVCRHSVFVVEGCLRAYSVDANGFEHILQFAPPGWWVADMFSLISGRPGQLNIDALEDSEVLLLSKVDQERLLADCPKFERFFRLLIENSLVASRQRIVDSMSLTAQERYSNFCGQYPTLIHSLPQKQIAAYIGVTPEFLSKMRGRMARKK